MIKVLCDVSLLCDYCDDRCLKKNTHMFKSVLDWKKKYIYIFLKVRRTEV